MTCLALLDLPPKTEGTRIRPKSSTPGNTEEGRSPFLPLPLLSPEARTTIPGMHLEAERISLATCIRRGEKREEEGTIRCLLIGKSTCREEGEFLLRKGALGWRPGKEKRASAPAIRSPTHTGLFGGIG